ncbi:MAG: hypothetical protein AB9866_18350 [Syntrophobacteraceae bacterium]
MNLEPAEFTLTYRPDDLRARVIRRLANLCGLASLFRNEECQRGVRTSSVMLLLGEQVFSEGSIPEACIILNKRSKDVKQPGDLCCPGGAVEKFDPHFARLLSLPGSTLSRWPCWRKLKQEKPNDAEFLSLLLTAGLREGWEEMRLNPFGIKFLGPLPSQCLVLFRRVIHPMVAWVSHQKNFTPSWEVERIVYLPFRALLNPFNYALYRLYVPPHLEWRFRGTAVEFPCFVYSHQGRAEILWGVTFRIVTLLLDLVFGFRPPDSDRLPLVPAIIGEEYVNGRGKNGSRAAVPRATTPGTE